MINKIELLKSIGKFRDYQAAGQVNFHKLTLVYGDNGAGKTTLTSIFRSLTSNNPAIIKSRISTSHSVPQAAVVTENTAAANISHTFHDTRGWSLPLPDIEIFDIHFINENIYSGFEFNDDQKKRLHQFVIGAAGIAIQNQIIANKDAKEIVRQKILAVEQQLLQQVGNNLTLGFITGFIAIQPQSAVNIQPLIAAAELALQSANASSTIHTLPILATISQMNSGINFTTIIEDLQTTSQSIQDEALQTLFVNHCEDLTNNQVDGSEVWLKNGYAYIAAKQLVQNENEEIKIPCPFCKQDVDSNIDIINAYALKFNSDFNSLVNRVETHLRAIQNFNIETVIQGLNNVDQMNTGRVATWRNHLDTSVQTPIFNLIADENLFKSEVEALISAIGLKLKNPSVAVSTDSADTLCESIRVINQNIVTYNQEINNYNSAIIIFKGGIQTTAIAQQEVDRLKRIQQRFMPPVVALCNDLVVEKANLRTLANAYPALIAQQQTATLTFFTNYKNRINYYLGSVFKTLFRIDDVVNVPPQGQAIESKIGYKLTMDGNDISFNLNQPFSAKECLSEGDKSTIALSFFLSKLDIDPNQQNKILIFDDPLSSLDTNRRTYTVGIIKTLMTTMKQVIVLSHNEHFLYQIGRDIQGQFKKTLRITENFAAKASKLEILDLDDLVKDDYFKQIEALEDFRINPQPAMKEIVLG